MRPPSGWITLFTAIDRICCRKFEADYFDLVKISKSKCQIAFREVERVLLTGAVPTKLIFDGIVTDFTILDMHLSPFRIHFNLGDFPGIEVARNKERLSDLLIQEKDFELVLASGEQENRDVTPKDSHEIRKNAFSNLLITEMKKGIHRNREAIRRHAKNEFNLSRKDADAIRRNAAFETGNERSLKGGRPKN